MVSRASAFFTSTPARAPRPAPTMMAIGVARADAQTIAAMNVFQRYLFIRTVRAQPSRSLWREIEQCPDGGAGLPPRTQLQHLAQQYQGDDHGADFKVNFRPAAVAAERWRKNARSQGCDHAEQIRCACPHRDQREHIQVSIDDGSPAALKEWPSSPEDDRSCQRELQPFHPARGQVV